MSEKVGEVQESDENASSARTESPKHQYSREELFEISRSPAALRRPTILEKAFDTEDGKWDPEKWVRAKFGFRESSPLPSNEGKERRDLDRDIKRRPSLNDPVERLKENERDIVLSPQRRSFVTGCHVQQFSRQISIPERDREREDPRGDRDRERDRDRDRDRVVPARKIGSGRITIDRENSRDFSSLRDRYDDRERGDRDFVPNRDRGSDRERDWDRIRDRDRDRDRDYRDGDWDRDRRFDRGDRNRRGGDRDFSDRDRRGDRDFRGYDRSSRRHYHREEKEPEWFTSGPNSQNEFIELRGFDKEGDSENEEKHGEKSRCTPIEEKASKDSASEDVAEADGVQSQCSSPEDDQHPSATAGTEDSLPLSDHPPTKLPPHTQQHGGPSPVNGGSLFDFEQILKANLPMAEENIEQGSRFRQFFRGPGGGPGGSEMAQIDNLIPQDLLESGPSPSPTRMGPMGAVQYNHQYLSYLHHQQQLQQQQQQQQQLQQQRQQVEMKQQPGSGGLPMPSPAGDNGASVEGDKAALPPVVTALFNSASLGGSNASLSSATSNFSSQDASAQLKAMLFGGGAKDSNPSSGTASPSILPASVQKKVKTVAELEADMHQSSPHASGSPSVSSGAGASSEQTKPGDLTAFNKLLIMLNAGSEASHNAVVSEGNIPQGHTPHGMRPGHSEFNHALLKNKEQQIALLQQSMQQQQHLQHHQQARVVTGGQSYPPLVGQTNKGSIPVQPLPLHLAQQPPPPMGQPLPPGVSTKGFTAANLTPQAMSTPHLMAKPSTSARAPSGSDPIFNLIQQHPTIVMNPASPAPALPAGIAAAQSQQTGAKTARIPSPLMFSQQPPLHLSAPSPIHPSQLSPHTLTVGANLAANTIPSSSGVRSPLPRVPSPQEVSDHTRAVVFGALLKKRLLDQSERYIKKQQDRAKSPNQVHQVQQAAQQQQQHHHHHQAQQPHINVVKPQPAAQQVLPPNPQPKGASVNAFTPTSVLRKMHSDKAMEKEKQQAQEGRSEEETEFMPSMVELSSGMPAQEKSSSHPSQAHHQPTPHADPSTAPPLEDLSDISFLDPVNPKLVSMPHPMEGRLGQTNVLPGALSHPMSVEEKLKLSMLAEKPGYLSQMLDKAAAAAEAATIRTTGHGRPIVKGPIAGDQCGDISPSEVLPYHLRGPPPHSMASSRPVIGAGPPPHNPTQGMELQGMLPPTSLPVNTAGPAANGGRAIVGGSSVQQMSGPPDLVRFMEAQRLQQQHSTGNLVLPPPPPLHCMGPPPVAVPVGPGIVANPVHSAALLHQQQQMARATALHSQLMALQHQKPHPHPQQQHRGAMPPMPPLSLHQGPLSPQTGPLSPSALSATLQRVASPLSMQNKLNGPSPTSNLDMNSGIQRWFSPDILRTQLPSMPPLPTQGSHVMTVDELERN